MGKQLDLSGARFGKWTVLQQAVSPPGQETKNFWLCRCDCGAEAVRRGAQLRYAEKKGVMQSCQSCGAKRHGHTGTPLHKIWIQMRDRCRRPQHPAFARYGGRGITVCERWEAYENFAADMGERPSPKHSIDRIDNDKGYSPDNCRWATNKEQNRNRTGVHALTFNGRTQPISAWAEETGIDRSVLYMRINQRGWSVEMALTTKTGKACNWRGTLHTDATKYEAHGQCKSLSEWARDLGVPRARLAGRLKRGWSAERALSK